MLFSLNAEPVTEISGGPDIYVDRGSTLNITCAVAAGSKRPEFIYWSKNKKVLGMRHGLNKAFA